jgi:hypothetical protein
MQSLKEFVGYTKKSLSIIDTYALRENAANLGIGETALVESAGFAIANEIQRTQILPLLFLFAAAVEKGR